MENAKAILDKVENGDADVTQNDVDNAWKELISVMQYLSFKQGDKTDLEKVIFLACTMESTLDSYLDKGKEEFTKALAYAKTVLEDGDAMQEDVDGAWKDLLTAMANLQLIPDKTALNSLIEKAESLKEEQYETESYAVLRTAVAKAKSVAEDGQAEQTVVTEAETNLQKALDGLILAEGQTEQKTEEKESGKLANAGTDETTKADAESSAGTKATAKSAKTGDETETVAVGLMMAAALAAMVTAKKRKEHFEQ